MRAASVSLSGVLVTSAVPRWGLNLTPCCVTPHRATAVSAGFVGPIRGFFAWQIGAGFRARGRAKPSAYPSNHPAAAWQRDEVGR